MTLTSSAFLEGERIPVRHTCSGEDRSPPLAWSALPQGAASLALICEDPDAPRGLWVHWVLYNLPPDTTELPEGSASPADQGVNDFGTVGYRGPCPPPGKPHRYVFRLFALDSRLKLAAGKPTRQALLDAMQGHVLAEARLTGTFSR